MRKVEVYFKNENDAESARADLEKYNVHNTAVEKVPDGTRAGGFIPLFSPGSGSGSAGIPFFTQDRTNDSEAQKADPKYMSHMLRFEVDEKDYEETIAALKNHDSYHLEADNKWVKVTGWTNKAVLLSTGWSSKNNNINIKKDGMYKWKK